MFPQADAEGAGALVVPHALADMGHGMCRIHICLLFPREVTLSVFVSRCSVSWFYTINLKPNSRPHVFTVNTGRLFEAETIT